MLLSGQNAARLGPFGMTLVGRRGCSTFTVASSLLRSLSDLDSPGQQRTTCMLADAVTTHLLVAAAMECVPRPERIRRLRQQRRMCEMASKP
jgi:hypothetical protein